MEEPTMEEVLELVEFDRGKDGGLRVRKVYGTVCGSVIGSVWGNIRGSVWGSIEGNVQGSIEGDVWANVWGTVRGKIQGRKWQYVETPKERAIRLIREGKGEEAIKVLEEEG